jgi:hypothetical protein
MKRIHDSLRLVLQRHRIVFWYDATREWEKAYETFADEGVRKLTVVGTEFGAKVAMHREPDSRFLVYLPSPRPLDADNWLLDFLLQGHEYKADRASLVLQDIGLPYELHPVVEAHVGFFDVPKRVETLKGLLTPNEEPASLRRKLMAVAAGARKLDLQGDRIREGFIRRPPARLFRPSGEKWADAGAKPPLNSMMKPKNGLTPVSRCLTVLAGIFALGGSTALGAEVMAEFKNPPHEFSVMPFWFWNDDLKDDELLRQIADFEAHGVHGFVIHPRIGLPRDLGWLSPRMIRCMRVAIEEAARRGMFVVLYDEGMYPSGSSSGQVVARNPQHAARGLAKIDLAPGAAPTLQPSWKLVATLTRPGGQRLAVVERPTGGVIRGLHYLGDESARRVQEETPPAGDILNPAAVASFIELVYDRYAQEFGVHFGKTILGIFTDEPSLLGRDVRGLMPGSAAALAQVNRYLGYDFTPFLADLWFADTPDSARRRVDYRRAINHCLEENYYRQLSEWCGRHGVALTGHPAESTDLGTERYFHYPGQDLVWRYVEPGPKALEGPHSTMANCASSAMVHLGRRRNANELYGAYGHNLTHDEMTWLASWCFVRGQNLLYPHAFYYSVRGPRRDERPPDVGPHAAWWGDYKAYADACRRLSWLNTDSRQICEVAILGDAADLPFAAAKVCFQRQRDFNYLELRHLWEDAKVDVAGVHLAGMTYRAVILDGISFVPEKARPALAKLAAAGRLLVWNDALAAAGWKGAVAAKSPDELVAAIDRLVVPDITLATPSPGLRVRHVVKGGRHFYLLFNEDATPVTTAIGLATKGARQWLNPATAETTPAAPAAPVTFQPHELKLLSVQPD